MISQNEAVELMSKKIFTNTQFYTVHSIQSLEQETLSRRIPKYMYEEALV